MSLYEYVAGRTPSASDPLGLGGLDPSIRKKCIEDLLQCAQSNRPRSECEKEALECLQEFFLDWYRREDADRAWLAGLPSCPCTLKKAKDDSRQDGYWPSPAIGLKPIPRYKKVYFCYGGSLASDFHPGATHCCKSKQKNSHGAGQQCCYDAAGNLITSGAGAGSADRGKGGRHHGEDVLPFYLARDIDRLLGGSRYRRLYCEVRPIDNSRGCDPNPTPWPELQ